MARTQKNSVIKKSVDIPEDLHSQIEAFVTANPGTHFGFYVIQALVSWVKNPDPTIIRPKQLPDSRWQSRGK
jgi:hypothetical protein